GSSMDSRLVRSSENPICSDLWWRWLPDTLTYPSLRQHIDSLRREGIRTLGYINSFWATEGILYETARARGYLVRRPSGKEYRLQAPGFPAVLVDFTNPEAYAWLQEMLYRFMREYGFSGWMADYTEWLPWDAQVWAGRGADWHNRHAVLWAKLHREATEGTDVVFLPSVGTLLRRAMLVFSGWETSLPLGTSETAFKVPYAVCYTAD
ncbi:MAG: glycoside hydrolase family 31 protein, partial [Bacteroidia bacterium]|nr:glycoside hydrolase family 31 protein [Bacteroidia bacterium]